MPLYCDVALPVPLDQLFTYGVNGAGAGEGPVVGARVIVPFAGQRLMGVVVKVHGDAPVGVEVKPVQQVLDDAALLPDELMELARWIAGYYVAPLGEVLRGMMPLGAEVKRQSVYRISDAGRRVLYEGAAKGSSRRSKLSAEEQNREYSVLNYLEGGEAAKLGALRSAAGANKALLDGMVKKKWLVREALAEERDARRLEKVAVVVGFEATAMEDKSRSFDSASRDEAARGSAQDDTSKNAQDDTSKNSAGVRLPRLNENQLAVMAELAAVGGRMRVVDLRRSSTLTEAGVPESTLGTLVRRGLVVIEEVASVFHFGGVGASVGEADSSAALRNDKEKGNDEGKGDDQGKGSDKQRKKDAHEHALNEAQMEAVGTIAAAMAKGGFRPHLLYGVTGSGKTTVYFAAMQRALDAGKSALLLVPEIGLTPAMVGQMVAAFGGRGGVAALAVDAG